MTRLIRRLWARFARSAPPPARVTITITTGGVDRRLFEQ